MLGLKPDGYYVGVLDIDPSDLVAKGYRAVLLDLDNTLQPRGEASLSPEVLAWVASLKAAGLRVGLVSNTKNERVYKAAQDMGVILLPNAFKPFIGAYVEACAALGVSCDHAVMIGDQSYTDVLGAHRAGMDAIMVMPQNTNDPFHTHLLRIVDAAATRGMRVVGGRS